MENVRFFRVKAIVSPDGRIGFNYEHSAAEGPPIVHLVDACWKDLLVLWCCLTAQISNIVGQVLISINQLVLSW